ncbi:MAG: hypothetical protein GX970_12665 [Phyllobacteriaceae bacterium]|nr:hypothetical protein [Phyllobacteriaceae bacterium]
MELAVVLVMVLIGTGAIVYAGMRTPTGKATRSDTDGAAPVVAPMQNDADGASGDGSADGGAA